MSLQVWLPLNEDLHNQGLANITATNNGATVDNNGKIGKCYRFGTAKSFLELPVEAMNDFTTECTVSFWLKILTRNTGWDTYFQAGLGGTAWNNYVFGFLRNNSNKCCFTVSGEAGTSSGSFVTSDMELDTWYHITLVYQTGHCLIYMDGMLYHDYSTAIVPAFNNITTITIGCANTKTNYQSNCLLNDLRIYDHALSPLEVKHLAQGLVLHYPLAMPGQENLVTGSNTNSTSTNKWFGHSSVGGNASTIEVDETGTNCVKVTRDSTAQSSWDFLSYDALLRNQLKTNTIYTVSFDAKPSVDGTITLNGFMNSNATNNMTTSVVQVQSNLLANKWNHCVYHCTTLNSFDGITISGQKVYLLRSASLKGVNTTVLFKNIKVEEGEIDTPWMPNSTDAFYTSLGFNDGIEYDVSGFGNNGTRVGTFSWSSDTPRYVASTEFNGSQSIDIAFNPSNNPTFTVAGWFYHTGGTTYYAAKNSYYTYVCLEGGRYFVYNNNGSAYVGNWTSTANIWQHIVLIHDSETKKLKLYVNGSFVSQIDTDGTVYGSDVLKLGGRSLAEYSGKISDFRIYATALSADDVMALYKNAGYVDSDGNVYAYEMTE